MQTLDLALLILQLGVGLTFAAHGAQKLFGWWGGPGVAGWEGAMEHMGFRPARLFALTSAVIEFAGGVLLAAGLFTPIVAAVLVAQAVVIIGHVHWAHGFFNSQSGVEFPLLLGIGAAAIGLAGASGVSLDALVGIGFEPAARVILVIAGVVAGLVALTFPRISARGSARA